MAKIRFANGQVVNFNGNPTAQDVEEVARKLGIGGAGQNNPSINQQTSSQNTPANSFSPGSQYEKPKFLQNLVDTTVGKKGVMGTVENVGKPINAALSLGAGKEVNQASASLRDTADFFMEKAQTEKDPKRAARFFAQAKQILGEVEALGQMDTQNTTEAANRAGIDQTAIQGNNRFTQNSQSLKNIAGTSINAALTVGGSNAAGLTGKTFGGAVARGAVEGAGYSAAGALNDNQSMGNVLKSAAIGSVTGGAVGAAGYGIGQLGKYVAEKLPKRIMQSALGQSKAQLNAGKDLSEYALKNKVVGTTDKILGDSQKAVEDISTQIANNLKSAPGTVRLLKNEPIAATVAKLNADGADITAKEVVSIIDNLAPQAKKLLNKKSLSLVEANQLRSALDKTLGDRGFLTSQLPFNKEVLKTFANTLRENVKNLAPEGTRELFFELSKEIGLRDAMLNKASSAAKNQVLNAFDLLLAGGGFLGGGTAGALSSVAAKKAIQSTLGKTFTAVRLNQLSEILAPVLEKIAPAERIAFINSIGQFVSAAQKD